METLVWEILGGTLHLSGVIVALDFLFGVVIDEVVMGQIVVVEKLHENSVVVNEGASAEWVCEALDWHGVVVNADSCVDVKLFSLDSFHISSLFAKDSEPELTVVDIHEGILLSCSVLLDLLAPDVAVLLSSDHLGEGVLIGLETVHHHMEFSIILLYDRDRSGRVITDDASDNWELSLHIFRFRQVLEQLSVIVELQIRLQLLILLLILGFLLIL